jgi:DNA-binding HxlR family transcriptional regulator
MTRGYGQFCGLARALDLVGGRWSLLIVRELLTGPKRFTELAQALPGIPSNILAGRLRELEDAGLLGRALQAGRSTSVVYELTPYGQELEEPIIRLGLWGAKSLGEPSSDDCFSGSSLMLALRGTFDRDAAQGQDLVAEIRFDDRRLHVVAREGQVSFPPEPPAGTHLVIETQPHVFAELFRGHLDADAAVDSGLVHVTGSKRDLRRFFRIFHLPSAALTAS